MKKLLVILLFCAFFTPAPVAARVLIAGTVSTANRGKQYSTGLNGTALAGGATTTPIPMGRFGGVVEFTVAVTAGSSTAFVVTCEHSVDNSVWADIEVSTSGAVEPASETYTLSDGLIRTVTVVTRKRHLRCTFTDAGSGTIVVTGNSSEFSEGQ